MTINEYQEYVRNGASNKYTKKLALLGLIGEVGELADVIKKEAIYEDMSKFELKYGMSVKDKIKDECGDVLWQYMLILCKYNLNIEDIIKENVRKLNSRHGDQKIAKDGGGER